MTPIVTSAALQRLIAGSVALIEEVSDEEIAAKVKEKLGDMPLDEIKTLVAQFRLLKARAIEDLPRMRWGASVVLDDIKVARFAFDAARENPCLDEVAVRALLHEAWWNLHGR